MEEFNISEALDVGLFQGRLEYWTRYKYNPIRQSEWKMQDGTLITVDKLGTETIHKILDSKFPTPLPEEWVKLLQKELEFRQVDWDLLERLDSVKVEIYDPVFYNLQIKA